MQCCFLDEKDRFWGANRLKTSVNSSAFFGDSHQMLYNQDACLIIGIRFPYADDLILVVIANLVKT